MKLSDTNKDFLLLVQRSPKDEEGWAVVSSMLMPLVVQQMQAQPKLYELETNEDGTGKIRLMYDAHVLLNYL